MAQASTIEWTDATWNPVRGCRRVSPGCGGPGPHGGCYAEAIAARFSKPGQAYHGLAEMRGGKPRWTGELSFGHDLDAPLRWRRRRRIFVNSMSDLFLFAREEVATVFAIAVAAHHLRGHVFQVLTKRSAAMRAMLAEPAFWDQVNAEAGAHVLDGTDPLDRRAGDARATLRNYGTDAPPPGLWLGVSTEDQQRADERVPDLLATPAAVRFLSMEPLLGPVDLQPEADFAYQFLSEWYGPNGFDETGSQPRLTRMQGWFPRLDWVIVGGESGPRARPMHPEWARAIRDQCAAAGVPFHFKQWGEWIGVDDLRRLDGGLGPGFGRFDCCAYDQEHEAVRVGKAAAGRLLDGVVHDGRPADVGTPPSATTAPSVPQRAAR